MKWLLNSGAPLHKGSWKRVLLVVNLGLHNLSLATFLLPHLTNYPLFKIANAYYR